MKHEIARPAMYCVLMALALATLAACDRPMSYTEASAMAPYKGLTESDRSWLYNYHQTVAGSLNWAEDELNLHDDKIKNIWHTSDGKVEIDDEVSGKSFAIKRDKLVKMVRAKGGPAAAAELFQMARQTFNNRYPAKPEPPYITPGLSDEHRRSQKLCYPQLFELAVVGLTRQAMKKAEEARQAGQAQAALEVIALVIKDRQKWLGENHPATVEAMKQYQALAGKPYVESAP